MADSAEDPDAAERAQVGPPGRRVNVYVQGDLLDAVRAAVPGLNVSAVLAEALRGLLGCNHERLACARCAAPMSHEALVERALTGFYGDVQAALGPLVRQGATAEGAARRVREVAVSWRLRLAAEAPAPRPTRAERSAAARGRGER